MSNGKYSVFGGLGYYSVSELNSTGGAAFAAGFRIFSEISNHRYFGEASYSMLAYQGYSFLNEVISLKKYYGPGVQIGYQVIGDGRQSFLSLVLPDGLTLLASAGVGYANIPNRNNTSLLLGVSIGYTLR